MYVNFIAFYRATLSSALYNREAYLNVTLHSWKANLLLHSRPRIIRQGTNISGKWTLSLPTVTSELFVISI
jgi:hypothetical protein